MVTALVDTSVLVDVIRKYPLAQTWLAGQTGLGISYIVWLELIEGAKNSRDQQSAIKLLNEFELVPMIDDDLKWATNRLIRFWLSHNVDVFDCLIGSVAYRLQLPLYTRNLKHFGPLLGALAIQPY